MPSRPGHFDFAPRRQQGERELLGEQADFLVAVDFKPGVGVDGLLAQGLHCVVKAPEDIRIGHSHSAPALGVANRWSVEPWKAPFWGLFPF